jgi:hypothetical protein
MYQKAHENFFVGEKQASNHNALTIDCTLLALLFGLLCNHFVMGDFQAIVSAFVETIILAIL